MYSAIKGYQSNRQFKNKFQVFSPNLKGHMLAPMQKFRTVTFQTLEAALCALALTHPLGLLGPSE